MTCIQSEPNFTRAGAEYAASLLTTNITFMCNSEYLDKFVFGAADAGSPNRDCLYKFKNAVSNIGFRELCKRIEFDSDGFLQSVAVERRRNDIDRIVNKFESRKAYLKPLLAQAKIRGRNKYGETDFGEYVKEIQDFLEYYFKEDPLAFFYTYYPVLYSVRYLEHWFGENDDVQPSPSNGIEFEYWCAARIEKQGWDARVTKESGDQGVDILATRDEIAVAIQCKRYGQPVGNKAVQEAFAGRIHYQAEMACVISTAGFTASARELAKSTGVILLDAESVLEFTNVMSHGRKKGRS